MNSDYTFWLGEDGEPIDTDIIDGDLLPEGFDLTDPQCDE